MEKIYVDENETKKNSKFKQVMGSKVPHHFSALLILVAFASFLTIGLRNNQSYAMTEEELGTSFTTEPVQSSAATNRHRTIESSYQDGQTYKDLLMIQHYYVQGKDIDLYCLDKEIPGPTEGTEVYNKDTTAEGEVEAGIIYIMQQRDKITGQTAKQGQSAPSEISDHAKYFIIQSAIYFYQQAKGKYAEAKLEPTNFQKEVKLLINKEGTQEHSTEFITNPYDNYIKPLVDAALNHPTTKLDITKSGNVTVTSDNKYYKSPIITISGLNGGSTYTLKATNAPEGTKIYTNSGKEITNQLQAIDVNDNQIYMLVPIDKVTEKTKTVTLSVTGPQTIAFRYLSKKDGKDLQPLTTLLDDNVMKGIDLVYEPSVPDTSMNAAQSIYFIGLVILLCGLGIIYANAKPKVTEE